MNPLRPATTLDEGAARTAILGVVRSARPPAMPAPDVREAVSCFPAPVGTVADRFTGALRAAGGTVSETTPADLPRLLTHAARDAGRVWSTVGGDNGTAASRASAAASPHELEGLDLFACRAMLGVAENGAVWLPGPRRAERAALFLASQVVVVLDRDAIVSDFHAAYQVIDLGAHPFGVFVAGPSKTADIEQSLVVGAHGPRQFHVILLNHRSEAGSTT